jgi:broad specificity phosphatase PhoE
MLLRIYLVRHGETEWSRAGRHTSRTEVSLTGQGEADARAVGRRLRNVSFSRILTSPRLRARQSCEEAGFVHVGQIEPDLAEWEYGSYEGLRTIDILEGRPGWNLFKDGCPGGETPSQVAERATRLIEKLRGLEGNVVMFSHAHFLRVFATQWIGLPLEAAQRLMLETSSLCSVGFEHDQPNEPVIALWNEPCR